MIDSHPTDTDLRGFVLGDLPEREWAAVEDHLDACSSCVERAAAFPSGDTLVKLLAAAGTRMAFERSAATTPLPQDTHSAYAGTNAWKPSETKSDGPIALGAVPEPPPIFAQHPRYQLVRWIGAGGMGSVWEAKHLALDRPVAIKVIRPEFVSRPGAAERFRREARTVARVSHPNIVAAYDAEELGGTHYLVMELVDGENLGERLGHGALPVDEACRAVRDAARGLAHAHAHGLVHRDIKPHNLIRSQEGVVKILDFGLATAETFVDGLTSADMMLGTPDYIAPEQAQDARAVDSASDVYSLGCTLFALLSGAAPFAGGTALSKLDAHRHGSVPPLKNVPTELAKLVEQMMSKRPQDRPTATAVAQELEPYCHENSPAGHKLERKSATGARAPAWRSLRTVFVWAGLALLLGVIVKIQVDRREIEIESSDPNIKIVTRQNGELVRIENIKTKEAWQLDTKRLQLKPDGTELTIRLPNREPLVLSRDGNRVVKIRWRKEGEGGEKVPDKTIDSKQLSAWKMLRGHTMEIRDAAIGKDGKTAYTAAADGTVRIWNIAEERELGRLDHRHSVMSLALAEDEQTLLSVTYPIVTGSTAQPRLFAWNLKERKEAAPFPAFDEDYLIQVAVSPDGEKAVTVSAKGAGKIRLWNIADRKQLRAWQVTHPHWSAHAAWSPDGKWISISGDVSISIWDAETGDMRARYDDPAQGFTSSVFTPDGKRVVGCGWQGIVRVIDAESGKLLRHFDINRYAGRMASARLAVMPKQGYLLGGCYTSGNVLNLETGAEIAELTGHKEAINAFHVSRDGKLAISSGVDDVALVWRLADLPALVPIATNPPETSENTIKPYRTLEGHAQRVRTAIFSRDSKTVYSGGDDNVVRVWDVESGRETAKFPADNWVITLALAEEGNLLLGSTMDRIETWDLKSGKKGAPFPLLENGDKVQGISVRPDGKKVAAGSVSGMVRVWDVAERKLEKEFAPPGTRPSYRVAWSPDGTQLIAGMDETLMVFDYPSGKTVHRIWNLRGITNVDVTSDGVTLVAHSWDAAVEVYDLKSGRMQREFNAGLLGGKKGVSGVIVDRQHLVTSGRGDYLDLWSLTGNRLATFVGHTDQVVTVNISPDRQWLASASEDTTVRIWKVPEGLK